jgi:hypothetical protein
MHCQSATAAPEEHLIPIVTVKKEVGECPKNQKKVGSQVDHIEGVVERIWDRPRAAGM